MGQCIISDQNSGSDFLQMKLIRSSTIIVAAPDAFSEYTSHRYNCGIYSALIFVESKALKQAHSELRNCFSNAAIGKKQPIEIHNCSGAKYKHDFK